MHDSMDLNFYQSRFEILWNFTNVITHESNWIIHDTDEYTRMYTITCRSKWCKHLLVWWWSLLHLFYRWYLLEMNVGHYVIEWLINYTTTVQYWWSIIKNFLVGAEIFIERIWWSVRYMHYKCFIDEGNISWGSLQ